MPGAESIPGFEDAIHQRADDFITRFPIRLVQVCFKFCVDFIGVRAPCDEGKGLRPYRDRKERLYVNDWRPPIY
ncbi:hypothetical protein RRF57_012853 [Xylaria bambusicola]|uniref:Uncharacterized protein n=1 Tax=Xylaria bambusicola TaxID=326684 RepID=A0AAN7V269_9PEZI